MRAFSCAICGVDDCCKCNKWLFLTFFLSLNMSCWFFPFTHTPVALKWIFKNVFLGAGGFSGKRKTQPSAVARRPLNLNHNNNFVTSALNLTRIPCKYCILVTCSFVAYVVFGFVVVLTALNLTESGERCSILD